jgi:hypothetical protein
MPEGSVLSVFMRVKSFAWCGVRAVRRSESSAEHLFELHKEQPRCQPQRCRQISSSAAARCGDLPQSRQAESFVAVRGLFNSQRKIFSHHRSRTTSGEQKISCIAAATPPPGASDEQAATNHGVRQSPLTRFVRIPIGGGQVLVNWGWQGYGAFLDQCELQVDRGDGKGFVLLAIDTTPATSTLPPSRPPRPSGPSRPSTA